MQRRCFPRPEVPALTPSPVRWPQGKAFAFTVFDDTDCSTLKNVAPVYDLLERLGMRTTKSVWPLRARAEARFEGATLEDEAYLVWCKDLRGRGFEIALHGASAGTNRRDETFAGLEIFARHFGPMPPLFANHSQNRDSIYWGSARFSRRLAAAYNLATRFRYVHKFAGHIPSSPYFWGDLCQQRISAVRNFVFADIDTLRQCPFMPYHDPDRPLVRRWFAASDGAHGDDFCRIVAPRNQEHLERRGGACIVYTHFGVDFVRDGCLRPDFVELVTLLSRRNGWYVPVSDLLAHLERHHGGVVSLTPWQRSVLEWRWMTSKISAKLPR